MRADRRNNPGDPSQGADRKATRPTLRSAQGTEIVAAVATIPFAMPECEVVKPRPLHSRQDAETPLLIFIKALVKRRRGVGIAVSYTHLTLPTILRV